VSLLFGRRPNVYSIAPEHSFVDSLAAGLLAEAAGDTERLVKTLVLLPTRRACRSLAEAFLRQADGKPMLLPRLTPLGDIDEEELAFDGWDAAAPGEAVGEAIPPAISGLRRQLLLTRLILADPNRRATPDQAAALAVELARLLDQVHTERLDLARLAGLVPDAFAKHWQITLDFLRLLTDHWPRILADEGALDPAERRNRLLAAQAEAWTRRPPEMPVVAAGSTGSIPATADLLAVIAGLPCGAVVLPGFDRGMDDAVWAELAPSHPQFGMARLVDHLGIDRGAVAAWPTVVGSGGKTARTVLINRALRPAAVTETWREQEPPPPEALEGVRLIDCPGPQEEAGVIALVLRQSLEEDKTAALITPDRGLARRVAGELARWQVTVDDSAGQPLAQSAPGAFLRLTARMTVEALAPVPLLACLKHPLAGLGMSPGQCRSLVRLLELKALRGPRPEAGLYGLLRALTIRDPGLDRLLDKLEEALADFLALLSQPTASLPDLLKAHVAAAERLAATDEARGQQRLWAGDAGEAAASFVAELYDAGTALPALAPATYPALLDGLLQGRVVRPRYGAHPRLAIWGLLEARLQRADVVVLGGLNEGTWPPETTASPWMSRPMMREFGLPLPERRIGLAAHDFAQAFAAPTVVLTRATRVEGTPTVPSRWLLRLETLLSGSALKVEADSRLLRWQELLDRPARYIDARPPAPKPPVEARPRKLSVTRVETWMRDPYGIYARYILDLQALHPIDADPGAADYGSFIHESLDAFLKLPAANQQTDAVAHLLEIGRRKFGVHLDRPGIRAFWWPRFERIARWFVEQEAERRIHVATTFSEVRGSLTLEGPAGPFELTAIADRIDLLADGGLAIVDYKTGAIPKDQEVAAGFAPQLPLEGAIVARGGFIDVPATVPSELSFWRLHGGAPAGECRTIKGSAPTLVKDAIEGVARLIAAFDLAETPYQARPRSDKAPRYDDYEHLARVKEWASGEEEGSA
jgi:ATP-dependent helicase/nuclease subunit B